MHLKWSDLFGYVLYISLGQQYFPLYTLCTVPVSSMNSYLINVLEQLQTITYITKLNSNGPTHVYKTVFATLIKLP